MPLIVGHRGAAAHVLENTAASFAAAVQLGAGMIELDLHESLDGEFIVIHDTHLGRISSRRDVVRRTHSSVLLSIELAGGHRLLTLSQTFAAVPQAVGMMVEIKAARSYQKLARLLEREAKRREVLTTSFDLSLLRKLQQCGPTLRLGVVSTTIAKLAKARSAGLRFEDVCLDFQCLTASRVLSLHRDFGRVFAWTVDRPNIIRKMIDYQVDGIVSNQPDEVARILSER
ncbi:MAG: glycerophosphodiester phosphodiesterase [Acidimicrobiia bacterium]|nr:glycerophosphodiester phosphodiesterase [Acidimicrobiia bacterium]